MNFEKRLNDLLLLSADWRTNELFKLEAARCVVEISERTATTEDRRTLSRDLGGLKAVIETQDRWLRNQLVAIQEPGFKAPVQWMI